MGTWGPGNLDSDRAGEHLDYIYGELIRIIRECFASDRVKQPAHFFETYGEHKVMPTLDVLVTLIEHYDIVTSAITSDEVREWKKTYLEIFDKAIDQFAKREHKVERRPVIENTFNTLERILTEFENF